MKKKFILVLICILSVMVLASCGEDNPITYKVKFDIGGHGTQINAQIVEKGHYVSEPKTPTEEGFIFDGWYTESKFEHRWDFDQDVVKKDMTLYAKWDAQTPLCLTAVENGVTIEMSGFANNGSYESPTLQWSRDGKTWTDFTIKDAEEGYTAITTLENAGDCVYFQSKGKLDMLNTEDNFCAFELDGKKVAASGDVMSLLGGGDVVPDFAFYQLFSGCKSLTSAPLLTATVMGQNCYESMFDMCEALTVAPALPATVLDANCYHDMFADCTALTEAPELPAQALVEGCYSGMFSGCDSLVNAPELPATKLAYTCYESMFQYCDAIKEAPALPAKRLADGCYAYMFAQCKALNKAPLLPAKELKIDCYCGMFEDCVSLETAPELPATKLASECYYNMFDGCEELVNVPDLNATELSTMCYYSMFSNCSKLTKAPALPATEMAKGCYEGMFENCTSLVEAPELPATKLASECYYNMFGGCTSLEYAPTLPAAMPEEYCYAYMFDGCEKLTNVEILFFFNQTWPSSALDGWLEGVSATGTFNCTGVVPYLIENGFLTREQLQIPEGWSIKVIPGTEIPVQGKTVQIPSN